MFCPNCGNPINEHARFCASCGAVQRWGDFVPPPAPTVPASARPAPRKTLKDRFMDNMLIPVAIILLLMGVGYMALSVVGRAATAQVTGIERVYIINTDESTRDPRRYKLDYEFSAGGERYTGSVTRVFEGGSHMRSTIEVRYLPFWPHVNTEDGGSAGFAGPVMVGVGVLVLVLGIREKSRLRNKRR